jgi:amino acid adenylation domain-containing protein
MKVHNWFEEISSAYPTRIAAEESVRAITFQALAELAGTLARNMHQLQLGGKHIVALMLDSGIDYIASLMGVLKAGHVFMPLNTDFPDNRIIGIIKHARPRLFVIPEKKKTWLAQILDKLDVNILKDELFLRRDDPADDLYLLLFEPIGMTASAGGNGLTGHDPIPDDACYVMTTSGSTGVPKVILGSHRGLSHFIRWEIDQFNLNPEVRGSFLSHITFDVSLRDIFAPMLTGGTVCIPEDIVRSTPGLLIKWIGDKRISLLHIVPTLLRMVLNTCPPHKGATERLKTLEWALIAGEPLYGGDLQLWRSRINTTTGLVNIYGPSETTLAKLFYEISGDQFSGKQMIPIGRPIPDTQVFILNEAKQLCGIGEVGEVYIQTPFRSLGYLYNPEEEALSFVPHPLKPQSTDLVYKTGDLGKYDEQGDIICLGRRDNQYKIHGNRIEINEIEAVLRMHAWVRQAAVGIKKDPFGNDRLIGYIVPKTDMSPTQEKLKQHAHEYLPAYMVPAKFELLERIPLTHNNKVDRNSLPEPTKKRPVLQQEFVAPKSELETKMASIWERILDLDSVGIDDNFFDIGGTSILCMLLTGIVEQKLECKLSVTKIFEFPTIRKLVRFIDNSGEVQPDRS